MAFVDHDQVEEFARKLAEDFLPLVWPGDGLVETKINLVGGVDTAPLVQREGQISGAAVLPLDRLGICRELRHRSAKRTEVVDHGLVDQDVAVGEEQDALLLAGLPETPDDLEGCVGLSGARRHDKQQSVLPFGYGLYRSIDRVHLIIARYLSAAIIMVILKNGQFCFAIQCLPVAVARPEVGG